MENKNSIKISWIARKKPQKVHTKNRPYMKYHILYSGLEYSEQVGFDSDGLSTIFYNSSNSHILSEEDMLND